MVGFPLPALTLPSLGSGAFGTITKIGGALAGVPVLLGIWHMFVMRMPPGNAGTWVSWNRPIYTKRHQFDECVHQHGLCPHPKKWVKDKFKNSAYERKWYWENLGIQKPRKETVFYWRCDLKRKDRCKCSHQMGKIVWEGTYTKWPWRRAHEIPLLKRDDQIVPLKSDAVITATGRVQQRYFEAAMYYRVIDDPRDDGPLRADHMFVVRDLDSLVRRRVRGAANRAELNYGITTLSKAKVPENEGDWNNRALIFNYVNNLCRQELHDLGVVMTDFEVMDAVRTPESVLTDGLTGNDMLSLAGANGQSSNGQTPVIDSDVDTVKMAVAIIRRPEIAPTMDEDEPALPPDQDPLT